MSMTITQTIQQQPAPVVTREQRALELVQALQQEGWPDFAAEIDRGQGPAALAHLYGFTRDARIIPVLGEFVEDAQEFAVAYPRLRAIALMRTLPQDETMRALIGQMGAEGDQLAIALLLCHLAFTQEGLRGEFLGLLEISLPEGITLEILVQRYLQCQQEWEVLGVEERLVQQVGALQITEEEVNTSQKFSAAANRTKKLAEELLDL